MQVLIELDANLLRRLEKVAPGKSRKRSAFIRAAIQQALWSLEEGATRQAYLDTPDDEPAVFAPGNWEPLPYGGFDPPVPTRSVESRQAPQARGTGKRPAKRATPRGRKAGRAGGGRE